MKRLLILALLMDLLGCSTILVDPSVSAVQAGDYTLAMSVCGTVPGQGVVVCRAKEGSVIASHWTLVLAQGGNIKGGECDVQYRDLSLSIAIKPGLAFYDISLADLMGHTSWATKDSGTAVVYCNVDVDTGSGIQPVKARGFAFFIVTSPDYDPMPIDSGFVAVSTDCKIQYSTSGRSAIKCN